VEHCCERLRTEVQASLSRWSTVGQRETLLPFQKREAETWALDMSWRPDMYDSIMRLVEYVVPRPDQLLCSAATMLIRMEVS
jgi:hypothetical protein